MSIELPKVPVLPTLVTLASAACGFTAILYASTGRLEHAGTAAWVILAAIVLDGVDGRLARMTRSASDFGIELDSLCDLVSFGVAPALLALSVMGGVKLFAEPASSVGWLKILSRLYLVLGIIYVGCAAVRLARFNVITSLDEEAHHHFTGLPSPAAAGVLASLVIAIEGLAIPGGAHSGVLVQIVLPGALVLVSVLMVSRVRYSHLLYELSKAGRSVGLVAEIFFAGAIIALLREFALAVLFSAYVLSGLVGVATDRVLSWLESGEGDARIS